jgi:DNA polymerase-3 subunit beta
MTTAAPAAPTAASRGRATAKAATPPAGVVIELSRETLLRALADVLAPAAVKSTLAILSHVRFIAEPSSVGGPDAGRLRLTTTDLDWWITVEASALVEFPNGGGKPIAFAAPARKLSDLVRTFGHGLVRITVDTDGRRVRVKEAASRGAGATILTMPVEEFPEMPPVPERAASVRAGLVHEAVKRVAWATSGEPSRPIMNGVSLELYRDRLWMAATSGHYLAAFAAYSDASVLDPIDACGTPDAATKLGTAILPPRVLQRLDSLFPDVDDMLDVGIGENHLAIMGARTQLVTRLIEGPYPNWRQVVPRHARVGDSSGANGSAVGVATVDVAAFAGLVRRMQVIAGEDNHHRVALHWSPEGGGALTLTAQAPDVGSIEEQLAHPLVEYEGDAFTIGFSPSYILDLCKVVPTERARWQFQGPERAARVTPVEWMPIVGGTDEPCGRGFVLLLMPLRLDV